jgi:hypothetical protein
LVEAFVVVLALEATLVSSGGFGPGAHHIEVDTSGDSSGDEFGAVAAAMFCQALLEAPIGAEAEIIAHELLTGADGLVKAKEIDHSILSIDEEKNSRWGPLGAENTEAPRGYPTEHTEELLSFLSGPEGHPLCAISVCSVLRCYFVKG